MSSPHLLDFCENFKVIHDINSCNATPGECNGAVMEVPQIMAGVKRIKNVRLPGIEPSTLPV